MVPLKRRSLCDGDLQGAQHRRATAQVGVLASALSENTNLR